MTEYHHFDKQSGLSFILTQQSMGRSEYVKSGHLYIFYSFEALTDDFEVQISRASCFNLIKDTGSM